ncbi:C-type lectin domain family 4 member K-like isoform X1 [Phascolarctos cinereus]|uniref:C-type lectin domain family 4 member K-like isoform X1 n=1 Tax=Phascolarctos cinereus TaxID=38626 RepID=A0A6P5LF54_PHACI|nr:C-type lectin domain family 4 member K-like isoform X1 [Phascolarctos cinereus]
MVPQTEKAFRKLRIVQAALALLAIALAAALKVVVILYLQGKNGQLERAKVSNAALKQQNQILVQRISERSIIHGGNRYYFSCGKMSWNDAEQYCVLKGSHLVSVTSVEQQKFLYEKANGTYYWIGLSNQNALGWQWTDGTPYDEAQSTEFWANEKPSNEKEDYNCAHFWAKTQKSWNNYICTFSCRFICKWNCESSRLCPNI